MTDNPTKWLDDCYKRLDRHIDEHYYPGARDDLRDLYHAALADTLSANRAPPATDTRAAALEEACRKDESGVSDVDCFVIALEGWARDARRQRLPDTAALQDKIAGFLRALTTPPKEIQP